MILRMPWRHFLEFFQYFHFTEKSENISEEISNSFHDKSHF